MFEGLRARLERLLAEHTRPTDPRARIGELHAAVLELKVAVGVLREGLATTEAAVAAERRQLEDAERRGHLAQAVPDPETVEVARQFAERHRERLPVLERKLAAQREELRLAEGDLAALEESYRRARLGTERGPRPSAQAAWRDLEKAGGDRPEMASDEEQLRAGMDRAQLDAAVDAQLEFLKRKFGKQP